MSTNKRTIAWFILGTKFITLNIALLFVHHRLQEALLLRFLIFSNNTIFITKMITLLPSDIIDLFFRFCATGIFIFMLCAPKDDQPRLKSFLGKALIVCIIAYLLLTTPIDNDAYGWLRQPLLLLTDLTAFVVLGFANTLLYPNKKLKDFNTWIIVSIVLWCAYLFYFFLVTPGKGVMHDINHLIAVLILIYVVFICMRGYQDDLVDKRRNLRLLMTIGCAAYMTVLGSFELAFTFVKDHWIFSMVNAVIIFLLALYFAYRRFLTSTEIHTHNAGQEKNNLPTPLNEGVRDNVMLKALNQLMDDGYYQQPSLTIKKLAQEINYPEHQLRQLINQELGFTNFSYYLNSYRIPAICEKLADASLKHIPILTLALDMGYGSIASFNRAFKQQMAITPSQYRDQF